MNGRSRLADQSGATLLMIIGIAAALAVMSATLVFVVGNMQANTADSRTREKASAVGEAAVDAQMYALGLHWPDQANPNPAPSLDAAMVRSQFSTSEFPNATGNLVQAVYYDNSDVNGDGKVDWHDADTNGDGVVNASDHPYDKNGDGQMYVEGQGKVGKRSSRFQALVQRTFVNTSFPHGIAVYDGGALDSNGGGNNPKIHVYNDGGYSVNGYVNGTIGAPSVFDTSRIHVTSPVVPPLNQLLPDSTILQVIDMAKSLGRYYDVAGGKAQMPTDLSGICVIRVADGTPVTLSGGINMADGPHAVPAAGDQPGILLILGPEPAANQDPLTDTGPHITINLGGNDKFYGVLYTDGQLNFAHGTPGFFGMVVFKSYMDMRGTADISYDDSAITKLFNKYTLSVKLVANTWREIQPH